LLLLLVGCGRIGFDPLGGAIDPTGDGRSDLPRLDAPMVACTPSTEVCGNLIDDNCNGVVDEGCPCTPFSITIGQPAGTLDFPPTYWDGMRYHVLWQSGTSLVVSSYDAAGTAGPPVTLGLTGTYSASATTHGLYVDPSGMIVAVLFKKQPMQMPNSMELVRFDSSGTQLGVPIQLSASGANAFAPQILPSPTGFVVMWTDTHAGGVSEAYLASFSLAGARLAPDLTISDGHAAVGTARLIAVPYGYAVFWQDYHGPSDIHFHLARIELATSAVVRADVAMTDRPANNPDVAWMDGAFAVTWTEGPASGVMIQFRRLDWGFAELGRSATDPAQQLDGCNVAWQGTKLAVLRTNHMATSANASTLIFYYTQLGPDGSELVSPEALNMTTAQSISWGSAAMFADGTRGGVSFMFGSSVIATQVYLYQRCF
jgi:hypothetical protein